MAINCAIFNSEVFKTKDERGDDMEIERKFLFKGDFPVKVIGDGKVKGLSILQGYIFTDDGELRLRSKGDKYFLTVKSDGTLSRDEWESEIPDWVFNMLWVKTDGKRIQKTRYEIKFQEVIIEFDKYHGHLEGLIILECEFQDELTAWNFILPKWARFSIDITKDKRYKNKYLALSGLPVKLKTSNIFIFLIQWAQLMLRKIKSIKFGVDLID